MSITDKPSSLRWVVFINICLISIFLFFSFVFTSFFPIEMYFIACCVSLVIYIVTLQYVFDIWGDKIFTDPRYWIKKEDMDNFLKQKIIYSKKE